MRSGSARARSLAALAVVVGIGAIGLTVAPSAAAATGPVVINEVQTSGTTSDFVELTNTGATTVDISGYQLLDDNDDHDPLVIPAGTTLAPGAFAAFDTNPPFGLGGGSDSARLFASDGTTLLDSYTWTTEAATSWGRCPDATGAFAITAAATRAAANDCAPAPLPPVRTDAVAWPGSQQVEVADGDGVLGEDQSGLFYEAATSDDGTGPVPTDVLWAVQNDPGVLWRLVRDGSVWTPDTANGWANGKQLRYPDGSGEPDSEGVTLVGGSSANGVFVATERDNADDDVSRPTILRFDVSGSQTELVATAAWDMTADLPAVEPNLGFEALTWYPDAALIAGGFVTAGGDAYDPAAFGDHFGGLFLGGLEADGNVYAYALDEAGTTSTRVATFSSGFPTVMELQYDADRGDLRAVCDNTCTGQQTTLSLQDGGFVVTAAYQRPTGLPDVNNEGFAVAPDARCVDGVKPAIWADDDGTDGHALREGTIACLPSTGGGTTSAPISGSAAPTDTGTPPLAATGAATGIPLGVGVGALAAGIALLAVGLSRRRGRHAA